MEVYVSDLALPYPALEIFEGLSEAERPEVQEIHCGSHCVCERDVDGRKR